MPTKYSHLSSEERDRLAVYRSEGKTLRKIGELLGRSAATLSRELRRNAAPIYTGCYLGHRAHLRAQQRWRETHQRTRLRDPAIRQVVEEWLKRSWSPETIAGRLALVHGRRVISHEAIYQWIYAEKPELITCLARGYRVRKRRGYSRRHRRCHIPHRVCISSRPAAVANRSRFGHWETDTAVSRRSPVALQATVERKSRYTHLALLPRKEARSMSRALVACLRSHPAGHRRSITYDNGSENVEHVRTNRHLGTRSFFCRPYHSWERGTVENTVGLVRRFFPKGTDFALISPAEVQSVQHWLNNRPRKCLGFRTPAEVLPSSAVALAP